MLFTKFHEMTFGVENALKFTAPAGTSIDSNNRLRKLPGDVGSEMCFGWVSREMPMVFRAFVNRISLF